MKDATGELSTTVIAVVAIAAIAAIFTAFLLPTLRSQIALTQACNNGPGYHAEEGNYVIDCTKAGASKPSANNVKECNSDNDAQKYYCTYEKKSSTPTP